jgi:hypothetical protein
MVNGYGNLDVVTFATASVNGNIFRGMHLYVRYTLQTVQLKGRASLFEGGSSPVEGVTHTYTGLDTGAFSYWLSVFVYETDFAASDQYVTGVYLNDKEILSYCNPNRTNGGRFFSCLQEFEVTSEIGTNTELNVSSFGTSSIINYPFRDHSLYVRYMLNATERSGASSVFEGGTTDPLSGVRHKFIQLNTTEYIYSLRIEAFTTEPTRRNTYQQCMQMGIYYYPTAIRVLTVEGHFTPAWRVWK